MGESRGHSSSLPTNLKRTKRFAPKTRTGCFTCRARRVKCDEQRPKCSRCHRARLDCTYPPPPIDRQRHNNTVHILPQPFLTPAPVGVPVSSKQLNLFGSFSTSVASLVGGDFNRAFWTVDVPRAAHVHPTIWHATIALTSLYHCTRANRQLKMTAMLQSSKHTTAAADAAAVDTTSLQLTSNSKYQMALEHYNKSLRHLAGAVSECTDGTTTYRQKEAVILANILYIGISSILEDTAQVELHHSNLVRLLEHWRFGDESPASRNGITTHSDLISILLVIDGVTNGRDSVVERHQRDWAIRVPIYDYSFTSITQAYTTLLPYYNYGLAPLDCNYYTPNRDALGRELDKQRRLNDFSHRLYELEASLPSITESDAKSLTTLHALVKVLSLQQSLNTAETREEFIQQQRLAHAQLLDLLAELLPAEMEEPHDPSKEPPLVDFSLHPFCIVRIILGLIADGPSRRRGLALLSKWTYRHAGETSSEALALYAVKFTIEATGPARTRRWQQAGIPVQPTFPNAGLAEGVFDGCAGCECIPDVFTCRDHALREVKIQGHGSQRVALVRCGYEHRNNLPSIRIPLG